MKRMWGICGACLLMLLGGAAVLLHAQSYESLWKQVEQAQKKNLPQTIISLTGQIVQKAGRENNAAQLLKAYLCRDAYREKLTLDSLYTHFQQLEQWAERETDAAGKAILHSLLAEKYAGYVQRNWRTLRQRTVLDTDLVPGDLREWSIRQFFEQIDLHSLAALEDCDMLMRVSTDSYVPFVEQEEGSRFYGHDLYHLLSNRAINAYESCLGSADDSLCNARIQTLHRVRMDAYRNFPGKEDAVLLSTLDYIRWQERQGLNAGPRSSSLSGLPAYVPVIDSLIAANAGRDLCAEAYIAKAELLGNGRSRFLAEALATCDEAIRRYPSYRRINCLKQLRAELLRPQLSIQLEQAGYPGDTVDLHVGYSQLTGFTLNLYSTGFSEVPWQWADVAPSTYRNARKHSSVRYDLTPLPGNGKRAEDLPYLRSDTVLRLPLPDSLGVYILQAVPDKGKYNASDDRYISVTRLKVLALEVGDGSDEFTVVDAMSGQPVAGASLRFFSSDPSEKGRKVVSALTANAEGKAILSAGQTGIRSYSASKGNDTAMPLQYFYRQPDNNSVSGEADGESSSVHLTLLTDRSLYRPGQTVYVKGIAYRKGYDEAEVLKGTDYEIALLDANRQEIATRKVRTNDFGSFAADFALPAACLNGQFWVKNKNGKGSAAIRVEEYKRPTFELAFTPVQEAYRLGDTVQLHGQAKAYNGRALQNVPLAYTVTRRNPLLSSWYPSEKPLVSDTVLSDAEGRFTLPVRLEVPGEGSRLMLYSYQIEASLTDDSGETQTASYSLIAGRNAYTFSIGLPSQLCREDSLVFNFGVSNSSGVKQAVEGHYRLLAEQGGRTVLQGRFTPNRPENFKDWQQLPSGRYLLQLSVRDSLGREEEFNDGEGISFLFFSQEDKRPAAFTDLFYYSREEQFDAGHPAVFLFGTSHQDAYVLMDVFSGRQRIESRALALADSIVRFEYPYRESYGIAALSFSFRFVKNGKVYAHQACFEKRQPDRALGLKWEVFRDRLRPGQAEEWKIAVKTPQGLPAVAELLALMYDASLDRLYQRMQELQVIFPRIRHYIRWNGSSGGNVFISPYFTVPDWATPANWMYDYFTVVSLPGIMARGMDIKQMRSIAATNADVEMFNSVAGSAELEEKIVETEDAKAAVPEESGADAGEMLQPSAAVRSNFAETAFFYPQLHTNGQGEIVCSFTMPESVTRWNFQAYAHTQDMMTGRLDASVVTAKEFMLTPNLPRFVRVGDKTQVAASIANLTQEPLEGTAVLTLFDPETEKVLKTQEQKFSAEAGQTTAVRFGFEAEERYSLLGVRLVADAGNFSDGEQHLLPVLSNKTCLVETLPMPIRGRETRTFSLDSLFNRNSRTATGRRLTVEFTGAPAWYAVQALPALSEPATDNATVWAAAYYAYSLAGHIANSLPRIKAVFDRWRAQGTSQETFLSRLQQNQDVKTILLAETPWLMEAATEAEQQARIATLFDLNQLGNRNVSALTKLEELQGTDGAWSWYKGMPGNRQMTGYITALFVRLPLMTGTALSGTALRMKQRAFGYLHKEALKEYQAMLRAEKRGIRQDRLSAQALDYLYMVALDGSSVPAENERAYRYFLDRVKNELESNNMARMSQASVILRKAGRTNEAADFIASIREHLIQEDELGAHFAFNDTPYDWDMMPMRTHVAAMEALQLAEGNEALTEEMKIWLLKQKQANSWDSPVATADAIYALLCQGNDLLADKGDARITLGKVTLETQPQTADAMPGLGYVKQTYTGDSPALKAKAVTVEKRDEGIAWGAVYAQYLTPIADVAGQGGALSISKQLYVERIAPDGRKSLQPVEGGQALNMGDKVVSRITLRLDRAMDFLQLKDQRGACFEPAGMLSGYRWQNGFGCYVEVEDAATNFFFDHLGKGGYVLEYSYRLDRQGSYQTGLASIQCAYAPEYAAHTAGGTLTVE